MENDEQAYEEIYYENKKENRDYIVRVTLCQMILCTLFVAAVFGFSKMSDENREKIAEGLGFLQSGSLTEEIQAVKDWLGFDAQI